MKLLFSVIIKLLNLLLLHCPFHGDGEQLTLNSFFLVSPVEDAATAARDGSSEAVCVCGRADRPSGETEARAGHAQLSRGKITADTGG